MIADLDVLIKLFRVQGVAMAKKVIVERLTKDWPTVMAVPVLGPVFGFFIGQIVGWVVSRLANEAEFLAFMANTYAIVNEQANKFEESVDKVEKSQTESELDEAEKQSLEAFDNLAKFNR